MDWGDGSKLDFYKNSDAIEQTIEIVKKVNGVDTIEIISIGQFIPVEHTYAKKGIYRVTISGRCDVLYGWDTGRTFNDNSPSLIETLVAIIVPKDSTSPLKYAHGSFCNCTNFCYFGYGVLHNATTACNMPRLFYNTQLKYLNKWFFRNCFELVTIENGFVNTPIVSIPEEFFKYTTKLDWINGAFRNCNNLIELPSDMFKECKNLRTIDDMFNNCINLKTVPEKLFDNCQRIFQVNRTFANCVNLKTVPKDLFVKCKSISTANRTFYKCNNITSNLPPLWNRRNPDGTNVIPYHNEYAYGCTLAANYNEAVIAGWT